MSRLTLVVRCAILSHLFVAKNAYRKREHVWREAIDVGESNAADAGNEAESTLETSKLEDDLTPRDDNILGPKGQWCAKEENNCTCKGIVYYGTENLFKVKVVEVKAWCFH
eukprot:TRINITY_DN21605_c0_g6_i1.p1 TRINITY_DN21605_c0_g6~~TRINITY_DN21605_c0_g6_i1.p1  ORF type:complete len:111 (+),score=3.33 TRINITY_DN21605_c0_g6_i1:15-347(+)